MKLPRWVAKRRSWWPYLYWLAVLALCVTLLRQIWAGNWSLILTLALGLAVGLRVFKEMVESLAENVVNRRFSPWHSAQRSIVFPRVWTLHITLYTPSMERWFSPVATTSRLLPSQWNAGCASELLRQLKIEEYNNRIRVHRWLVSTTGGQGDIIEERYDWADHTRGLSESSPLGGLKLWSYSRDSRQLLAVLHLSAVWRRDRRTKRHFLELTLWLQHPPTGDHPERTESLFSIPLDPVMLDEERGAHVYVDDVVPYPVDSNDWETDGEAAGWSWHLRMQTFDIGSLH
jgi:hypothetical protein